MIVLYTNHASPNSGKVIAVLEELGLPYRRVPVDIAGGEQHGEAFRRLSPNGTVPALVDEETGATLFESSAILLYLADKTGRLLPGAPAARAEVQKWLMFEAANVGAIAGELYHYVLKADDPAPYAIERCRGRLADFAGILDRQLAGREFLCGELSIADFAHHPWAVMFEDFVERPLADYPRLADWSRRLTARAAARAGSSEAVTA
jgi:GSH-dependent disulfide-bond oxidoreductase